jgi:hypothetical protein
MLNSKLTTCNTSIGSSVVGQTPTNTAEEHQSEPYLERAREDLMKIIKRRTENGKRFGKLEIAAEEKQDTSAELAESEPIHYVTGFVLDNSSSMRGPKIEHARNTVVKFLEIMAEEIKGGADTTSKNQIRVWFYLITFNDSSNVVVKFQEITEESCKKMIESVNQIYASGSTNYEQAFAHQSTYLSEILNSSESFKASKPLSQVHVVNFFETDGDITAGSRDLTRLYDSMRKEPSTTHENYKDTRFTYEHVIFGYGVDVDTKCLKVLAAPQAPMKRNPEEHTPEEHTPGQQHNCSCFISIGKPEDIGWQVGEVLFKLLTRCGANIHVSISDPATATAAEDASQVELFEYQKQTWSAKTTLHSIAENETKTIFVQIQEGVANVKSVVEMTDQQTGRKYTYQFSHNVVVDDESSAVADATVTSSTTAENLSMILGMTQIEIFKLMRELEADESIYEMDTIVTEAYKVMRILKYIKEGKMFNHQTPVAAAEAAAPLTPEMRWLENLIMDTRVIIGLTTIGSKNEQLAIIHARRTSSAEREFFSTGQKAFGVYIDGEEFNEEIAKETIKQQKQKQEDGQEHENQQDDEAEDEFDDDCAPQRIATATVNYNYSQSDAIDSVPPPQHGCAASGGGGSRYTNSRRTRTNSSLLRTLCASIANAKNRDQPTTAEELYVNIVYKGRCNIDNDEESYCGNGDDTFSSIPDDEHSSKRVRMMRQMSSPNSA